MHKKVIYTVVTLLLIVAVVFTVFLLCSHPKEHDTNHSKLESTPVLLDSIKSIRQWELLSVDATTDVDTTISSWVGLVHNTIERRYYGKISLGINMQNISENWHHESHDTITLNLPDIILLDDNFVDESKTQLVRCDDKSVEADNDVRKAMYERAYERLRQQGTTDSNKQLARKKAEDELSRLFRNIGYNVVTVNFR